jgi:hypothetical protein
MGGGFRLLCYDSVPRFVSEHKNFSNDNPFGWDSSQEPPEYKQTQVIVYCVK